jgi:hypothetical protein
MRATRYSMSGVGTPTDLRPGESKHRLKPDPYYGSVEAADTDDLGAWLGEVQTNIDDGWRALDSAGQNRIEVLTGRRLQQMSPPPRPGGPWENPDVPPTISVATIKKLVPESAVLGSPSFTLSVKGTGFVDGDTILWNGSAEPTTFVDDKELTTGVNMETAAVAMEIPVSVKNASGEVTNALPFTLKETAASAKGVPAGKHAPKS